MDAGMQTRSPTIGEATCETVGDTVGETIGETVGDTVGETIGENGESEQSCLGPLSTPAGDNRLPAELPQAVVMDCGLDQHLHHAKNTTIKVALFDLDWTLIAPKKRAPKSKKKLEGKRPKFPSGWEDWDILFPEAKQKLQELWAQGYIIGVVTNQTGKKYDPERFHDKLVAISKELEVPFAAMVATKKDGVTFKPAPLLVQSFLGKLLTLQIKPQLAFMVGDAAGREGDFACSDRQLAVNLKIPFYTPEEFFCGEAPKPFVTGPNYAAYVEQQKARWADGALARSAPKSVSHVEMVILVGMPAAGKSTLAGDGQFDGYDYVSRDVLKTKNKCLKAAALSMSKGRSVIIDNTNPTAKGRAEFVELARHWEHPVRCIHITTPRVICEHLNKVRVIEGKRKVPDVVYHVYAKYFEQPELEREHFTTVEEWTPILHFEDKRMEEHFKLYL